MRIAIFAFLVSFIVAAPVTAQDMSYQDMRFYESEAVTKHAELMYCAGILTYMRSFALQTGNKNMAAKILNTRNSITETANRLMNAIAADGQLSTTVDKALFEIAAMSVYSDGIIFVRRYGPKEAMPALSRCSGIVKESA